MVKKTGDTMTGNLTIGSADDTNANRVMAQNAFGRLSLEMSAAGNAGLYDMLNGGWIVRKSKDGTVLVNEAPIGKAVWHSVTSLTYGTPESAATTGYWTSALSGEVKVSIALKAGLVLPSTIQKTLFTLPEAYRPKRNVFVPVFTSLYQVTHIGVRMGVLTSGAVVIYSCNGEDYTTKGVLNGQVSFYLE